MQNIPCEKHLKQASVGIYMQCLEWIQIACVRFNRKNYQTWRFLVPNHVTIFQWFCWILFVPLETAACTHQAIASPTIEELVANCLFGLQKLKATVQTSFAHLRAKELDGIRRSARQNLICMEKRFVHFCFVFRFYGKNIEKISHSTGFCGITMKKNDIKLETTVWSSVSLVFGGCNLRRRSGIHKRLCSDMKLSGSSCYA